MVPSKIGQRSTSSFGKAQSVAFRRMDNNSGGSDRRIWSFQFLRREDCASRRTLNRHDVATYA
jgi:hypothetical protein